MKFDSRLFPKYSELSQIEKTVLKTCCYFPPKKRRERSKLIIEPLRDFDTLRNAFGNDFLVKINTKKVLDFGCGEGQFVIAMATQCDGQFEGIDIQDQFQVSEDFVKKHHISNVKFHLGNSQILEDASYDIIISHDSFEHYEDPSKILDEMVRLLKPDGLLLIKFGPTWMSPYGRHMNGTFKKNRPWIHLLISEKIMMRVHSVYHNDEQIFENYVDLTGGLNKMTIKKAKRMLKHRLDLSIESFHIFAWRNMSFLTRFPLLKELFGSGVRINCRKNN